MVRACGVAGLAVVLAGCAERPFKVVAPGPCHCGTRVSEPVPMQAKAPQTPLPSVSGEMYFGYPLDVFQSKWLIEAYGRPFRVEVLDAAVWKSVDSRQPIPFDAAFASAWAHLNLHERMDGVVKDSLAKLAPKYATYLDSLAPGSIFTTHEAWLSFVAARDVEIETLRTRTTKVLGEAVTADLGPWIARFTPTFVKELKATARSVIALQDDVVLPDLQQHLDVAQSAWVTVKINQSMPGEVLAQLTESGIAAIVHATRPVKPAMHP